MHEPSHCVIYMPNCVIHVSGVENKTLAGGAILHLFQQINLAGAQLVTVETVLANWHHTKVSVDANTGPNDQARCPYGLFAMQHVMSVIGCVET